MSVMPNEILRELETVQSDADFATRSSELVERWVAAETGVEAVEPILRFMESHPDLEYGMPGSLVHFTERFHGRGYERLLLESIGRQPTSITTWMLNRLINGTKEAVARGDYVESMRRASVSSLANPETRGQALRFLKRAAGPSQP